MRKSKGFTLIEVMITVLIIAILSAFAVPAYNDYVMRGRITEATSGLSARRIQAEQYFQDNRTYADVGAFINPACVAGVGNSFAFQCINQTATTYTIQATGNGTMAGFVYTINENGAQSTPGVSPNPGWIANANCWITAKGGRC